MTLSLSSASSSRESAASNAPNNWYRAKLVELLPRLRAFAVLYCGSVPDAEDAVQSTCLRALERWQQWTGKGPFEHWLIKILVNMWRSERRARSQRSGPPLDSIPEPSDGKAAELDDLLYLDQVKAEIMRLPRDQRAVLLLVVGEGLSYRDAADLLGVAIGTIMSRMARARSALSSKLCIEALDEHCRNVEAAYMQDVLPDPQTAIDEQLGSSLTVLAGFAGRASDCHPSGTGAVA